MREKIAKAFGERFKVKPRMFFAPGRINLIGEHVDYNDGYVMPAAIDKGIWFATLPNGSSNVRCFSYDMNEEVVVPLDGIHPDTGWKNYILGVLHVMKEDGYAIAGVDMVFGGDLPVGAGLSSSAAVECGLAFALNKLFHLQLSRKQLALLAQRAEHLYPGVKCGIMDQYASLMGQKDNIIMLDCASVEHQYIPFNLQQHTLVLINSKVQHSLAAGEYNIRRKQCSEGLAFLRSKDSSIGSFRDVTADHLETYREQMEEVIYRRCCYVVGEIERTRQASDFLTKDDIAAFGELMYQTHRGLSTLYEVSCAELDFLVKQAAHNKVTGARVMGGGFGGCTINLLPANAVTDVIKNISEAYQQQFGIMPDVLEVHASDGVRELQTGMDRDQ